MALTSCTACQEVVDAASCRCPHCDATLRECRSVRTGLVALLGLALASGTACVAQPEYGTPTTYDVDGDGDGYLSGVDCDDTDADVNPGAPEVPGNGVDDDCDGEVDEAES